ncbi:lysosome-associated membrane glycoprotein 1-like isoform X2 [Oculina patagonica]
MMAAKTSLLRLCCYVIVGLVMVRSNTAVDPSNNTTPMPMPPAPLSGYGHFNVTNKNGKICILLDLSCSITAQLQERPTTYDLPLNAQPSGTCDDQTSSVSLSWETKLNDVTTNLTLSVAFMKGDEKWKTTSLAFTVKTNDNGTVSDVVSAVQNDSSKLVITASKEKSYKCVDSLDIVLNGNVKVTVTMKQIQVQPFGSEFGDADVCSSSSGGNPAEPVDTVVPTAVGCVLAGLIVILIITYFVGRCKRPGYEKM